MAELIIQDNIMIDEIEMVTGAIYNLTNKTADMEAMKKFILTEYATMFYLNEKLNSSTEPQKNFMYLWLDTGYQDASNRPIMICLSRKADMFVGHYTGTIRTLTNFIKKHQHKYASMIEKNYGRFVEKYRERVTKRQIECLTDERQYLLEKANEQQEDTDIAKMLKGLGFDVEQTTQEDETDVEHSEEKEEISEEFISEEEKRQNAWQEEITIGMLSDKIEEMAAYIQELLDIIATHEKQSEARIRELTQKNEEYQKTILQIRTFTQEEEAAAQIREEIRQGKKDGRMGHYLLGKKGKILVLGDAGIGIETMQSIAKRDYGFEKTDFEYEVDYEKVVTVSKRVHRSTRYVAVILGKCPHKVANIRNASSIIEEFRQSEDMGIVVVAKNEANELKITKTSFRNALDEICEKLKEEWLEEKS